MESAEAESPEDESTEESTEDESAEGELADSEVPMQIAANGGRAADNVHWETMPDEWPFVCFN